MGGVQWVVVVCFFHQVEACVTLERGFDPYMTRVDQSHLVESQETVVEFGSHDASRYFSLVQTPETTWVVWKNGSYPHAAVRSSVLAKRVLRPEHGWGVLWSSNDATVVTRSTPVSHNLAACYENGEVRLAGGLLLESNPKMRFFKLGQKQADEVAGPGLSRTGVMGCVEERPGKRCELDGRLSLARLGNETLLYARANANRDGGGRFVQVASTTRLDNADATWSPFQLISFLPGPNVFARTLADLDKAFDVADVYFAAVNANPVDPNTLLGLFPTVVRTSSNGPKRDWRGQGAVLLALTCDGRAFSAPFPLLPAAPLAAEVNDHPVDGFFVHDQYLHLFVHHGVPGTATKLCAWKLHRLPDEGTTSQQQHGAGVRHHHLKQPSSDNTTLLLPPSRIVRYVIPFDALRDWTRRAKASLGGSCRPSGGRDHDRPPALRRHLSPAGPHSSPEANLVFHDTPRSSSPSPWRRRRRSSSSSDC